MNPFHCKRVVLILAVLFISAYGWAQDILILTIDKFANTQITSFDAGAKSPITAKSLKDGFKLRIITKGGPYQFSLKEGNGRFIDQVKQDAQTDSGFTTYLIKDPAATDNTVHLKLLREKTPDVALIDLVVQPDKDEQAPVGGAGGGTGKPDCPDITPVPKDTNCKTVGAANKFGFAKDDLTKHDRIYVYDFDPKTSKPKFYRIKLKKNDINMELIDMTTETLGPKDQVWVKIAHINRFRYDANIGDTLVDYDSDPSYLFKTLFLGDSTTLLGKLITNIAGAKNFTVAQASGGDVKTLTADIECLQEMFGSLKSYMMKAYDQCDEFPCCSSIQFELLIKKLNNVHAQIVTLQLDSTAKRRSLEEMQDKLAACKTQQDKVDASEKALAALQKEIADLKTKKSPTTEETATLKSKNAELVSKTQEGDKLKAAACADPDQTQFKTKIADLAADLAFIDKLTALQAKLPKEDEIRVVAGFLSDIVARNQTLVKGPIQLRGNQLNVTIHIKSIDSVSKLFGFPKHREEQTYELPILGKVFATFSSGSFIAVTNRLQNKLYSWQEQPTNGSVSDTAGVRLVESGYSLPPMGFAALGNLEWRCWPSFGVGFSVGVGLTIETDPRLAYLAGGTLFFGDLRQFAVTGGIAFMQVNKLQSNLEQVAASGVIYSKTNHPTISYYKELRRGPFVSVTYTPFRSTKRKQTPNK